MLIAWTSACELPLLNYIKGLIEVETLVPSPLKGQIKSSLSAFTLCGCDSIIALPSMR